MSSRRGKLSLVSTYLPITRWLRSYTKEKFISDIIAGVTVGVTMIPQSIAYAALANLTPEVSIALHLILFIYIASCLPVESIK